MSGKEPQGKVSDERGPQGPQGRQRCASTSQTRGVSAPVGLPPERARPAAFWYVRAFRPWLRGSVRAGIAINLGFGQSADSTDEGTSEDGCLDGRGREAASPKVRSHRTRIHARLRLVETPPAPPAAASVVMKAKPSSA